MTDWGAVLIILIIGLLAWVLVLWEIARLVNAVSKNSQDTDLQLSFIIQQGEKQMGLTAEQSQAIQDALAQASQTILGAVTKETGEVATQIQRLKDIVEAGGAVSADQLQSILTGIAGIATSATAAIDAISASDGADATPAPVPTPTPQP